LYEAAKQQFFAEEKSPKGGAVNSSSKKKKKFPLSKGEGLGLASSKRLREGKGEVRVAKKSAKDTLKLIRMNNKISLIPS